MTKIVGKLCEPCGDPSLEQRNEPLTDYEFCYRLARGRIAGALEIFPSVSPDRDDLRWLMVIRCLRLDDEALLAAVQATPDSPS